MVKREEEIDYDILDPFYKAAM